MPTAKGPLLTSSACNLECVERGHSGWYNLGKSHLTVTTSEHCTTDVPRDHKIPAPLWSLHYKPPRGVQRARSASALHLDHLCPLHYQLGPLC